LTPYYFLSEINIPIQLQHGAKDESVPLVLSQRLKQELEKVNKEVEYYEYKEADHNISQNAGTAFERTVEFYNRSLKPAR
jgi:predicted esterase